MTSVVVAFYAFIIVPLVCIFALILQKMFGTRLYFNVKYITTLFIVSIYVMFPVRS